MNEQQRDYAGIWDSYARRFSNSKDAHGKFLGDEWGTTESTVSSFNQWVLPILANANVACELGVGGGKHTSLAAIHVQKMILGVDVSHEMISLATMRMDKEFPGKFKGIFTDGTKLPIENASVDAFYSIDAMVHIFPYDLLRYVREISRILNTGGKGVFEFADWDTPRAYEKFKMDAEVFYRSGKEMSSGAFGFVSRSMIAAALKETGLIVDGIEMVTGRTSVVCFRKDS